MWHPKLIEIIQDFPWKWNVAWKEGFNWTPQVPRQAVSGSTHVKAGVWIYYSFQVKEEHIWRFKKLVKIHDRVHKGLAIIYLSESEKGDGIVGKVLFRDTLLLILTLLAYVAMVKFNDLFCNKSLGRSARRYLAPFRRYLDTLLTSVFVSTTLDGVTSFFSCQQRKICM